jgi:hypothetical protein
MGDEHIMGYEHYWSYSVPANSVCCGKLGQEMPVGEITVTDRNDTALFYLESKDSQFRRVTIQRLYEEKVQWFEPLAKDYQKLIKVSDGFVTHSGVKHRSWKEIADFAEVDRSMILYYSKMPGDWKRAKNGGSGYLLVSVDSVPYWGDAIGQIPFAVNCFKNKLQETSGDINSAVIETIKVGQKYAEGTVSGKSDNTNSYDNLMILRGALWASKRYLWVSDEELIKTNEPVDSLKQSVSADNARKFGYLK